MVARNNEIEMCFLSADLLMKGETQHASTGKQIVVRKMSFFEIKIEL